MDGYSIVDSTNYKQLLNILLYKMGKDYMSGGYCDTVGV